MKVSEREQVSLSRPFWTNGRFDVRRKCEVHGIWSDVRDAHHAFERGHNSWKRIDLPWNLISLGTMLGSNCRCHAAYHNGKLKRGRILEIIAAREKLTVEWIIDEHTRLLLTGGKGRKIA